MSSDSIVRGLDRRAVLGVSAAHRPADPGGAPRLGPAVETRYGRVRGYVAGGIHTFRGLRYGASTGGANRFKPPVKPDPWTGTMQSYVATGGASAPQILAPPGLPQGPAYRSDAPISEDCLFLNLFTPGVGDGARRPVMVWIHGGGYAIESGTAPVFDGTNLARLSDVVVVTLNHRLGPFGHMYLADVLGPDYADSGNVGFLDMAAALEWVRDNIAAFGGDPGNVTLFAQSSGGGKVGALMVMPAAKGLFHKVIIESGATPRLGTLERARMATDRALAALGLSKDRAREVLTLPMERFLIPGPGGGGGPTGGAVGGGPIVDGRSIPRHPFDPDAPEISAHVPLLMGSNRTEMTMVGATPAQFNLDEAGLRAQLSRQLGARTEEIIGVFRASRPKATPSDLYFVISTFLRTTRDTIDVAERRVMRGGAPTYVYQFTWGTPVEGGKYGTPHGLELAFVFNNLRGAESYIGDGPELQPMADRFGHLWTSFARTGVPSAPATPVWEPYNLAEHPTLMIDVHPRLVHDPFRAERAAMRDIATTGPGR